MQVSKILVVDDEPEVRKLMEHFLTDRGYQVRLAANGREGLAAIDSFAPDVVLLDMHMPEMDGLETLKELAVRAPGLPVIMVTVNEDVQTTSQLLQLGAADYVPKPFNLDYLEQAINIQLSAARD
ncbi:MAG TPA: response regulator [Methylomirabilota bacterium]|jgi:DNA-binding response OmpR family regulator|nr:response regulator [Methylomirabilota bacterium]